MPESNNPAPPAWLVESWRQEWRPADDSLGGFGTHMARESAAWGYQQGIAQAQAAADAELDACCEWLMDRNYLTTSMTHELRAARCRKPPSLKQQALDEVSRLEKNFHVSPVLRQFLETISPEDESC